LASLGYVESVAFLNVEDLLSNSLSPSEVGSDVFLCKTGFQKYLSFLYTDMSGLYQECIAHGFGLGCERKMSLSISVEKFFLNFLVFL